MGSGGEAIRDYNGRKEVKSIAIDFATTASAISWAKPIATVEIAKRWLLPVGRSHVTPMPGMGGYSGPSYTKIW